MQTPVLTRGLTVIELLIVIAIIGVLAAVILSSLGDARSRGIDAKVRSEVTAISRQAAVIQSESNSYDEACGSNGAATSTKIVDLIASIEDITSGSVVCNSSVDGFAVSAPLLNGDFFCIDDGGTAEELGTQIGSGVFTCS